MKQIITDAKVVCEINENAQEPITVGISVPDDLEIAVGQILEDDLTVRDITNQEIIDRFGLQVSVKKSFFYNALTESELTSFLSSSKTTSSIELIKEIFDAGGTVNLIDNTSLVDENIITTERLEEILGITAKKEFMANGSVLSLEEATDLAPPVEYPEETTEETTDDTTESEA